ELAGCGIYEYDSARRQITSARIYFDVGTLLKQIIDQRHPNLKTEETATPADTVAIAAPMEHLDVATVIKLSQTVSGEMVLEKLLDTLMRAAVEYAGAERALLILLRNAKQRIAAVATTSNDTVLVRMCNELVTSSLLPETVLRHVLQTRESVILDDAAILNPFSADPYLVCRLLLENKKHAPAPSSRPPPAHTPTPEPPAPACSHRRRALDRCAPPAAGRRRGRRGRDLPPGAAGDRHSAPPGRVHCQRLARPQDTALADPDVRR